MTTDVVRVGRLPRHRFGLTFAIISAVAFGLAGPVAKGLMDAGWSPASVVVLRCLTAAVLLAPMAFHALRASGASLLRHWRLITIYGLVPVAGCQVSYIAALQYLPVSVTLLIGYCAPILVIAYLWARYGLRPGRRTALGGVIAIGGLVLLLDLMSGVRLSGAGVMWALSAMCCMAAFFVVNAKTDHDLPPVALAASGLGVGAGVVAVAAAVGVLPWRTAARAAELGGTALAPWMLVLVLGGALTAMPYLTAVEGARRLGAGLVSFVAMFEVFAAVVFAWLLLDQVPRPAQLIGGIVLLLGVVVIKLEPSASVRRAAASGGAHRKRGQDECSAPRVPLVTCDHKSAASAG